MSDSGNKLGGGFVMLLVLVVLIMGTVMMTSKPSDWVEFWQDRPWCGEHSEADNGE